MAAVPGIAQHKTREGKVQAERQEKQRNATPETISKTEGRLNAIEDKKLMERLATGYHGLTLVLGGLATGQGFALGPQYLRTDLANGKAHLRTSARYAFSNAYLLDASFQLPQLADGKMFVEALGVHRNYPRIDYFGPGPDSSEESRTHFRLEDTSLEGTLGVRPLEQLRIGVSAGGLFVNTGPGNFEAVRGRTEDVFTAAQVPGLDNQTNFLKGSLFAQLDYRDNPGGPRKGGNYLARFSYFNDRDLGVHDFRSLHLEAQQYFPFFNKRRVIALRARTIMTFTNGASSVVPFYLQPVLGGSDDLRGFRPYRFYDDNQIVLNGEYRWEAFTGLDMALFVDAGKVVPNRSQINFHDLESSVGFGFRFNVQNSTFIRIDTAFSHEGFQVFVKFADAF